MNCNLARRRIPALLDGELSEPPAERLRAHLADCSACREVYRETAAVLRAADAWEIEADADDLADAILDQIETVDLRAVLTELRRLRVEVRSLRAEIAGLRAPQPTRPARPKSEALALFPYMPDADRLHIM